MPRRTINPNRVSHHGPQEVPGQGAPASPTTLLEKIEELENRYRLLKDTVAFVKDTNFVVLVVLALGFISLSLSSIFGIIQAFHSNTATEIEFIKSVNNLTNIVNLATKSGGFK